MIALQRDSEQGESGLTGAQETESLSAQQPSTSTSTTPKSTKEKLKKLIFWQKKAAEINATANIDSNFTIGDSDNESA